MRDCYLAFDFGTSRLKAAVADRSGRLLALESEHSPAVLGIGGVSEMDMAAAWEALCRLSRRLLAAGDFAGRLAGVGVSGLGEGLWPVDEAGQPVRPAFLWNDSRARDLPLPEEAAPLLIENSVTPLFPAAPPVLLRWLKEYEPESYRRIRWAARCKDWLNFRLTGVMATDYSDASTAALNVRTRRYFPELFDLLGIPEAVAMLPPLKSSAEAIGAVTDEAAALSGIPAGVPVIAGALDAAAISLGSGMRAIGDAAVIFGTCLANESLIDEMQVDHADGCGSFLLPVLPQGFIRMMGTNNGVGVIGWARRLLGGLSAKEADALAETAPPGSGGVLFQPYLAGERAPFKNACAAGSFTGLSAVCTRAMLLRSVYEGVVYSVMDCRAQMPDITGTLYASGGGARCDLLCRMTASALGKPVLRPRSEQPGIDGIVSAIRRALGETPDFALPDMGCDRFEPDEALARVLHDGFSRYRALRGDMEAHWQR